MVKPSWVGALVLSVCLPLAGQTVYTYIGQITPTSVLIAWGTTQGSAGQNTIGRASTSMGPARVQIAGQTPTTDQNWIEVKGLTPDTAYPYTVEVNGKQVGNGTVRTHPARANRLVFFVIGDYGVGGSKERAIADAMWTEYQRRAAGGDPVRFVITVGDNIYANVNLGYLQRGSGDQDRDWENKFFEPYRELLRQIPFYPSLGNHDGNSSENRGDLAAYLDNFFFPENRPARWYQFSFGGLADFFALDSTENSTTSHTAPVFGPESEQFRWLEKAMPESKAPWKIPYFHHPPFTAGPAHPASLGVLRHWVDLFQKSGVKVVFTGHEHNLQFSDNSDATGHIQYVVTGAGGELRSGNVMPNMERAHIAGWAAVRHFLVVEIEGKEMKIWPVGSERLVIKDRTGKEITMPVGVKLD
jgi:tartrate-resistant acid phosphatase type 5